MLETFRGADARPLRLVPVLTVLVMLVGLVGASTASAGYSIKLAASDPAVNKGPYLPTYPKVSPGDQTCPTPSGGTGRAANPLEHSVVYKAPRTSSNFDAVTSLAPKDMELGQIVPFQFEIVATPTVTGNVTVNPYFLAKTTSGGDFGFDPSFGVYCAFVDSADPGTEDTGSDARVKTFTSSTINVGTSNEQIRGQVDMDGIQAGDRVILEVWVVLKSTIPAGVTGNVQTGIVSATEGIGGSTINVGNQTVPLLRVQEFFSSEADLSLTKFDAPDPVVAGSSLAYTVKVTNHSTDTVANSVVVTDHLDANTSFVSASLTSTKGTNYPPSTCSASGQTVTCSLGGLEPGEVVEIKLTVVVSPSAPTANKPSHGPHAGGVGASCPSNGVDVCNVASVTALTKDPNPANNAYWQPTNVTATLVETPAIEVTKTVAEPSFTGPGFVLHYTIHVDNTGNVPLADVTVTDPLLSNSLTCQPPQPAGLQPGDRMTCTGEYTTTQGDVQAGKVTNTAKGTGTGPGGEIVEDEASTESTYTSAGNDVDLELKKTASTSTAAPGTDVTFFLKVTNPGPGTATGVKVVDQLPTEVKFVSADPGCAYASGSHTVTCTIAGIPAGESVTREILVRVKKSFSFTTKSTHDHWVTVNRVERHVDLEAGETGTYEISCPNDAIMTDGSSWVQHVDQGTGTLSDVRLITARSTDRGTYQFVLENEAEGRAQVKLFGVCVDRKTAQNQGHAHDLVVGPSSGAPTTQTVSAPSAGRHTYTMSCPVGSVPVAPGWSFTSGSGRSVIWETNTSMTSWTFGFDTDGPATIEISLRCLNRQTSQVDGHRHPLTFSHPAQTFSIPPTGGTTTMRKITCGEQEKGILKTYALGHGLELVGDIPVPVAREFHLLNPTNASISAKLDLLCLGTRAAGRLKKGSITNTATVSHDGADPDSGNDSSSVTVRIKPGPGVSSLGITSLRSGAAVGLRYSLTSSASVRVTIRSASGGRAIASFSRRGSAGRNSIRLPRRLGAGEYRISISARDRKGRASGTSQVRFRVASRKRR
jgi:uncharacterized repeat protein (TIGR01451 family)